MIEYSALGIPPAYKALIVEIEETREYTGGRIEKILTTRQAYFDPALSEFHNAHGCVRGKVLRWEVRTES